MIKAGKERKTIPLTTKIITRDVTHYAVYTYLGLWKIHLMFTAQQNFKWLLRGNLKGKEKLKVCVCVRESMVEGEETNQIELLLINLPSSQLLPAVMPHAVLLQVATKVPGFGDFGWKLRLQRTTTDLPCSNLCNQKPFGITH